jgi:hypothetical protein
MSELHVQQIKGYLLRQFTDKIDLSDVATGDKDQKEKVFLTRSLAALAVMHSADVSTEIASQSVTDGTGDNGLDAIFFEKNEKHFFVVQSKWHSDGRGSIERGEVQKFMQGFRDLVNTRFDRFNEKVKSKQLDIETAVFDAQTRFKMIVIYSGLEPLAAEVQRDLDDLLNEMNDPTDSVFLKVMNQVSVHAIIATGVRGAPINLEVALSEWGMMKEPY